MFAKLIMGKLVKATNPLIIGKKKIYNPTEAVLSKFGFKPVIETPRPNMEDGNHWLSHWEETENGIERVWDSEQQVEESSDE